MWKNPPGIFPIKIRPPGQVYSRAIGRTIEREAFWDKARVERPHFEKPERERTQVVQALQQCAWIGKTMTAQCTINIGEVSLEEGGVIPVTRAAASLAEVMHKSQTRPTVVTQNGVPIGVIMEINSFLEMRALARQQLAYLATQEVLLEEGQHNTRKKHINLNNNN